MYAKAIAAGLAASLMMTVSAFAANAPAVHRSTQGDREVTALNLLEAKGYRDFKTVREHGKVFVVDAMRDGKNVTVTVNPDTGRIHMRI
jgi:hypothetical protein